MTAPGYSGPARPLKEAVLLSEALEESVVRVLLREADRAYAKIEALIRDQGLEAVTQVLSPAQKYLAHASSLSLGAVFDETRTNSLLTAMAGGRVEPLLREALGGEVVCDMDQAWVRRQYAPHRYPPGHAPHGWHQDGALGFDFASLGPDPPGADALLPMVTCWIALTECGVEAPGLEFVAREARELVPAMSLSDKALRERFPEDAFWRPEMRAGDAIVFPGGTLHRTHVSAGMPKDRTSVELRFVRKGRIPTRLAADRFVPFACVGF